MRGISVEKNVARKPDGKRSGSIEGLFKKILTTLEAEDFTLWN